MSDVTGIPSDCLEQCIKSFESDSKNILAQNACTRHDINDICLKRSAVEQKTHAFNYKIPSEGKPVANQKSAGTCWLYACCNAIRLPFMKEHGIDEFEFSQSYLHFWDKVERCNYNIDCYLECAKRGEAPDGRLISHLLQSPLNDGGQWDMLINLIEKHGLLPKSCFPSAFNCENSMRMNRLLSTKMREYCLQIYKMVKDGVDDETVQKEKTKMMEQVYKIVAICLGSPPKTFTWEYYEKVKDKDKDKDKEFKRIGPISPQEFYKQHVKPHFNMEDKVCLINDPRPQNPYNKLYTVEFLNNMSNGKLVTYINQPCDVLKKYATTAIKNGEAVWYGCDVGKHFHGNQGFDDIDIFDYNLVFGTTFKEMNKAERLLYGDSLMTHAMVLTAVNIGDDDKPRQWRVENSWGDERGMKGYLVMSDDWFSEFVYEVVIDKKHLPQEILDILQQPAVVLPVWDPMGALA